MSINQHKHVNHDESIIEIRDLSFAYGKNEVLKHVSLDIHRGDYLGVIGPNGAGKTTLIKLILGLLPMQKGSIKLLGVDARDFTERWKIGYVPQKVTNFDANFPATVEEIVLMGRYAKRGLFHAMTKEDTDAVLTALKQVDLEGYEKRLIGDLSGGEQQRVFIARALVSNPEIIFLDEPTTGVDKETRAVFYALMKRLNEDLNITLIMISHDIETVGDDAMHIAYVDRTVTFYPSLEALVAEQKHPGHTH